MNRDIKFRAWNKKKNCFANFMINLYGVFFWDDHLGVWYGEKTSEFSNYEIMQYTGLDDSVGREIYEGDILFDRVENDYCYVTITDGNATMNYSTWTCDLSEKCDCCEIVGNIYENPELLEKDCDHDY